VTDLAIAVIGLVAGLMVGLTSIGGVLVLPGLVMVLGLSPYAAIPAAMVSFIPPATIALLMVHRRGQLDLRAGAAVWLGAIPGAFAGAALLPWVPVAALLWAIAAMLAFSAARVFARPPVPGAAGKSVSGRHLTLMGLFVGAVSALTGTGGPITLMPILGWRGVEPQRAVMLCKAITLPITIFASLGYTYGLDLDWRLVCVLSLSATLGVVLGTAIAPRIRVPALARIIGAMMAVTAALLAARLLSG
jgi:hypothetical protein